MLYMVVKWKCIGDVTHDNGFCWSNKESKSMADYYHYYHYNEEMLEHQNNDLSTNINNNNIDDGGDRNTHFNSYLLRQTSYDNVFHHHHYHCRLHHHHHNQHHHHASTRTIATIDDPMTDTSNNSVSTGHLLSMCSTNIVASIDNETEHSQNHLESILRAGQGRPLRGGVMSDTDLYMRVSASGEPPPYSTIDINNCPHRNRRLLERERMKRQSLLLPSYEQVEVEHSRMISQSESAVQHPSLLVNGRLMSSFLLSLDEQIPQIK